MSKRPLEQPFCPPPKHHRLDSLSRLNNLTQTYQAISINFEELIELQKICPNSHKNLCEHSIRHQELQLRRRQLHFDLEVLLFRPPELPHQWSYWTTRPQHEFQRFRETCKHGGPTSSMCKCFPAGSVGPK
jgi:hypothetical protein